MINKNEYKGFTYDELKRQLPKVFGTLCECIDEEKSVVLSYRLINYMWGLGQEIETFKRISEIHEKIDDMPIDTFEERKAKMMAHFNEGCKRVPVKFGFIR